MTSRFVNLVLFVFNFVFLLSGIIILLLTLLYGRPEVSTYLGETTKYLNNIIDLLGGGHLVQIIHYSMLFCGITITVISLINITISVVVSWSKSSDHYYYQRKRKLNETEETLLFHSTLDSNRPLSLYSASINQGITEQPAGAKNHQIESISHTCARSSCALCAYIFVMLFLFTIQLVIGLLSVVTVTPERVLIQAAAHGNQDAKDDFMISVRESIHIPHLLIDRSAQIEPLFGVFHCCGWLAFDDYEHLNPSGLPNKTAPVPDACCKTYVKDCGARKHPNNIYFQGCWHRFGAEMRDYVLMLGWAALTFAVVELVGVMFAIFLYVQTVSKL